MTRIDFYSNVPNKIEFACRLIRKARNAQCSVVVLTQDRQQLGELDKSLWTFSEQDFLPHVSAHDPLAGVTPVILTDSPDAKLPHQQILINLTDSQPPHFTRFERMLEIISSDDSDKQRGRERYRSYQQGGYSLSHFVADKA